MQLEVLCVTRFCIISVNLSFQPALESSAVCSLHSQHEAGRLQHHPPPPSLSFLSSMYLSAALLNSFLVTEEDFNICTPSVGRGGGNYTLLEGEGVVTLLPRYVIKFHCSIGDMESPAIYSKITGNLNVFLQESQLKWPRKKKKENKKCSDFYNGPLKSPSNTSNAPILFMIHMWLCVTRSALTLKKKKVRFNPSKTQGVAKQCFNVTCCHSDAILRHNRNAHASFLEF